MMDSLSNWDNTGWASKNGKAVHVSEVERGLACDCVCPSCGGQLIARKGKRRIHHFAHAQKVDCTSLGESALHLACKDVIAEAREMVLPQVIASDGKHLGGGSHSPQGNNIVAASQRVRFDSVELERGLGRIIPDVTVSSGGHSLCIEILVTHAVSEEKALRYEAMKVSALEVDVSDLPRDAPKEEITRRVIECVKHKKWLHNAKAAKRLAGCARKTSHPVVSCPLPTTALLDNLPGNGWRPAARRQAYQGKVYWLNYCLYCKHALCFADEAIYCDATAESTRHYKKFPGGF